MSETETKLKNENDRLRKALKPFAEHAATYPPGSDWMYPAVNASRLLIGDFQDAAKAFNA